MNNKPKSLNRKHLAEAQRRLDVLHDGLNLIAENADESEAELTLTPEKARAILATVCRRLKEIREIITP